VDGLVGPASCTLCERDISKSVKIRCTKCTPAVNICLECLRTGQESATHSTSHPYYVFDKLDFPLLMKDWCAKDELQLIQGIMKCGLGNWKDVSEQYVKTKSPQQCEDHFYTFFNKGKEDYLPADEDYIITQKVTARSS
jgi:hypothetical protein